jgi:hypothetical protein
MGSPFDRRGFERRTIELQLFKQRREIAHRVRAGAARLSARKST